MEASNLPGVRVLTASKLEIRFALIVILSFNGGLTQVIRAFYPGQFSENDSRRRVQIDSAPHTVANGSFVVSEFYGFNSSLNWRHISNYRLDGEDDSIRAAGNDVVDFSISKHLRKWIDFNFSIDNVLNKKYFETQNYFESSVCPTCAPAERIHATPGYPFAVNVRRRNFEIRREKLKHNLTINVKNG